MEVLLRIHAHPKEETLEEYALERLPEVQAAALEEHLLICETCQNRLQNLDEYVLLMKVATAEYVCSPKMFRAASSRLWERIWSLVVPGNAVPGSVLPRQPASAAIWASAMGMALAACLLAASVLWRTDRTSPAATVTLAALRGGNEETMARGPAHRPLDLSIDIGELPASPGYRVEVVTSTGRHAWGGGAQISGGRFFAHVEGGLRAGVYWARLYSANGELLREFGLRIG